MSSPLTSHVLDTARGRPAQGLRVTIEHRRDAGWQQIASGVTNDDGRVPGLLQPDALVPGDYRATFDTGPWLESQGMDVFYPVVQVAFRIQNPDQHYHIPLLLSPYGYSTYRGS